MVRNEVSLATPRPSRSGKASRSRGAALLLALFVMALSSALAVGMLQSEMLRYSALANTFQWDEARYLAEAGLHEALAKLEHDIQWRTGIKTVEFPKNSGMTYSVTVTDGPDATVDIVAVGNAGRFRRILHVNLKQGG